MDLAAKIAQKVEQRISERLDAKLDALVDRAIDRALGGQAAPAHTPSPTSAASPRPAKAPKRTHATKAKRARPKARAAAPAPASAGKASAIADQVLAALATGPKSATQLLEHVKATKGGIHGACQRLVAQGKATRVEQGKAVLYGLAGSSTPT